MSNVHRSTSVLVLGAGLAGLAAAIRLARAGLDVTVLEASRHAGGCCTTHDQAGCRFHNGAVYLAVPSALQAACKKLGMNANQALDLVPVTQPLCCHLDDGTIVHLSDAQHSRIIGHQADARTERLRNQLGALQQHWGPVYRALVREILPHALSTPATLVRLAKYLPRMRGNVADLIRKHFDDPAAQAATASTLLYTGIAPEQLPATQIIGLLALLEEGFYLPRGGMGAIPKALLSAASGHGVQFRFGCTVERVHVRSGAVAGVVLGDGETIASHRLLATCSGFDLATRLLSPEDVPWRMRRRARCAPLSHRAIAIQMGCHGMAEGEAFLTGHFPPMAEHSRMHQDFTSTPRWQAWTRPTTVLPNLAADHQHIIECFAPATITDVADWQEDSTRRAVDAAVQGLRDKMPGLTVDTLRVMDPPYFARHHRLYQGALYGIAPGAPPWKFFPHRSHIAGLYQAGQTTPPGFGVPTTLLSGIHSAEALLADV